MKDATAQTIYLKDYQVPEFLIDKTHLVFDLNDEFCQVSSSLSIRRNPESQSSSSPLFLHGGAELELQKIEIDSAVISETDYQRTAEGLIILIAEKVLTLGSISIQLLFCNNSLISLT